MREHADQVDCNGTKGEEVCIVRFVRALVARFHLSPERTNIAKHKSNRRNRDDS
jgi:hypothetical protein